MPILPINLIDSKDHKHDSILPVALISIDEKKDRRILLTNRGIPDLWLTHYFPATDLRYSNHEKALSFTNPTLSIKILGRELRPSEIGCALSHRKAAEWLANSNFDMMLVLEDDIVPLSFNFELQITKIANYLLTEAKNNKSFICHLGARDDQISAAMFRSVFSLSKRLKDPTVYLHSDPVHTLYRAHAYLISKAAAKCALMLETPLFTVADDWYYKRKIGLIDEIYYSRPIIFSQDEDVESTVQLPVKEKLNQNLIQYKKLSFPQRVFMSIAFRVNKWIYFLRSFFPKVIN